MSVVNKDTILSQALTLPAADREAIAEALLLTVEDDAGPISPAWAAEIERRVAAVKAGTAETVDAFESLRKLREKYAR